MCDQQTPSSSADAAPRFAREQEKAAKKAAKEARKAKANDPELQARKCEQHSQDKGAQGEMEKKARKLQRALDDIEQLRARLAAGEQLGAAEDKKVSRESAIREELHALEAAIAGLSAVGQELDLTDASEASTTTAAGWSHYLVLDFEATCEQDDPTQASWSEIIEFPCVLVDAITLQVVSEFSTFVRPTGRTTLTKFCTSLTSITQADVDGAPTLDEVLRRFGAWLPSVLGSDDTSRVLPVTCGEPDLSAMLPRECKRKGLQIPAVLRRYCNIKRPYVACGLKSRGMSGMLDQLGLPLVGHHHRGIDDARNIANIAVQLVRMGSTIDQTGHIGKKFG